MFILFMSTLIYILVLSLFASLIGLIKLRWDYYVFKRVELILLKLIFFTIPLKTLQENFLNVGFTFAI